MSAGVVELADTSDLGSGAERFGGSNPLARNDKEMPMDTEPGGCAALHPRLFRRR